MMRKKLLIPQETNFRHLDATLKALQSLNRGGMVTLDKPETPLHQSLVKLVENTDSGFAITFPDSTHQYHSLLDIEHVDFQSGLGNFTCDRIFPVETDSNSVKAQVSSFYSTEFKLQAPAYTRLIIPYDGGMRFHYFIERKSYKTKRKISGECVCINYGTFGLDMYLYRPPNTRSYLIMDTTTALPFSQFMDYCFHASVALG